MIFWLGQPPLLACLPRKTSGSPAASLYTYPLILIDAAALRRQFCPRSDVVVGGNIMKVSGPVILGLAVLLLAQPAWSEPEAEETEVGTEAKPDKPPGQDKPDKEKPGKPPTEPEEPLEPVPGIPITDPDEPDPGNPQEPGEPEIPLEPGNPPTEPEEPGDCDGMDPLPIIPCGIGFGMATPAGSGRHESSPNAKVYKVTNLKDSGDGSLKACTDASGPRVCVFEVSGTIDMTDKGILDVQNPYITIAGQTAPSPGITIRGASIRWEAHDALIQHIRVRTGDAIKGRTPGDRDGIYVIGKGDDPSRRPVNVVFDHVSVSWGLDETFTVKDTARNVDVLNSIVSEGLWHNMHPKGGHSKGLMISAANMLVQGNLIAHNDDRNPLETSPSIITANNVTYNARQVGMRLSPLDNNPEHDGKVRTTTVVGNVRLEGENGSSGNNAWVAVDEKRDGSKIYIEDNLCDGWSGGDPWPCAKVSSSFKESFKASEPPLWLDGLDVMPASEVVASVARHAGARPKDRDEVDLRIIDSLQERTGKIPDCVGPGTILYPDYTVESAGSDSLVGEIPDCDKTKTSAYVDKIVEIYEGSGAGQEREIDSYSCSYDTLTLKLKSSWSSTPKSGDKARIHIDCSNNAGGWPELEENQRTLELPANYNEVMESGYTRLEEWLHSFYDEVQ